MQNTTKHVRIDLHLHSDGSDHLTPKDTSMPRMNQSEDPTCSPVVQATPNKSKSVAYTKTLTFRMDEERYAQLRGLAYRTSQKHQDIFIEMFDKLLAEKLKDGTLE